MIKPFVLKLIIALSLFSAVIYMSMNKAEAIEVTPEQLSIYRDCFELREHLDEIFSILAVSFLFLDVENRSEYVDGYNRGVKVFNDKCTPLLKPLEEIRQ